MSGNAVVSLADIIVFGALMLFAFYGFKRGALRVLYAILRIYFAFIITIFFYGRLALLFQLMVDVSFGVACIICFTVLFIVIMVMVWLISVFVKKRIAKPSEIDSSLSRIGGIILGLLEGALIVSIIIMVVNFYPVENDAETPLEHTLSYKVMRHIAPGMEYMVSGPFSRLKEAANSAKTDESESDKPESNSP